MRPWAELPDVLRDVDVNLAPLEPGSVFNESKSAIKWLEAALTATPTVASPTEPFRDAITDGTNGVLASAPEEWERALDELLDDGDARARLGERARRDALLRWSPHVQGERYLAILDRACARVDGRGSRHSSAWIPVALDEPAMDVRLEPYPPTSAHRAASQRATARLVRLARRSVEVWRQEGVGAAVRAAMRRLGRIVRDRSGR
jgi:hypothetical protein